MIRVPLIQGFPIITALAYAINGQGGVRERLNIAALDGVLLTGTIAIYELLYGAELSRRREENRRNIFNLIRRIKVEPFDFKAAEKMASLQAHDALPPWVANPLIPIPITPALVALGRTSMFTTGVLSMIDGTRSIVEVSQALGAAWGVEPGRLQDELRAFLAKLSGS